MPNPYPGLLIAFEGIDGCGKSTQLTLAANKIEALTAFNGKTVKTKEPNRDSEMGKRIYIELGKPDGLHRSNPQGFQSWYASDSRENLRTVIIPALRNGRIVLTDRYRTSMVYGVRYWNSDFVKLMQMHWSVLGQYFIWPDATFIFDVSVPTALQRLAQKDIRFDVHERAETLTRVKSNYRHLPDITPNCHLIDGEGEAAIVFSRYGPILLKLLKEKLPESAGRQGRNQRRYL